MKAFLLDTNIAAKLFDQQHSEHEKVRAFLSSHDAHTSISVVTLAEIRYGHELCQNPAQQKRRETIEDKMGEYKVWPIDRYVVEHYARIRARIFQEFAPRKAKGRLRKKHPEDLLDKTTGRELHIQENDLWIVAQAATLRIDFVTTDRMKRIRKVVKELYSDIEWWNPLDTHEDGGG